MKKLLSYRCQGGVHWFGAQFSQTLIQIIFTVSFYSEVKAHGFPYFSKQVRSLHWNPWGTLIKNWYSTKSIETRGNLLRLMEIRRDRGTCRDRQNLLTQPKNSADQGHYSPDVGNIAFSLLVHQRPPIFGNNTANLIYVINLVVCVWSGRGLGLG